MRDMFAKIKQLFRMEDKDFKYTARKENDYMPHCGDCKLFGRFFPEFPCVPVGIKNQYACFALSRERKRNYFQSK